MKKYTYPIIKVIELASRNTFADQYSLSDEEGYDQWSRKKSDDFGKNSVGGKLWDDMK